MKPVVLAFAGGIASGKSTLSSGVSRALGWPRVSFGDYVRRVARERMVFRLFCARLRREAEGTGLPRRAQEGRGRALRAPGRVGGKGSVLPRSVTFRARAAA